MTQLALPGTATAADVRVGQTFSSGAGFDATGTLPQVAGGNTITPGTTAQTAIAAETIADAAISVEGDANLVGANIKAGVSIFGVASTMPSQNAVNITPSTVSQTAIAAGDYAEGAATVSGDANLTSANVAYGVSIFGVAGTSKRQASGTVAIAALSNVTMTISGLAFTPSRVLVGWINDTNDWAYFDSASNLPNAGGGKTLAGTASYSPTSFSATAGGFSFNAGTSNGGETSNAALNVWWIALE